jgi:AcrR family transcriptional regulator
VTKPTPKKRKYDSTRRQAQARETHRQILAAARGLFIKRGYVGATMDAIAQEAGVATETVFALFGNKRTILTRLIEVSVGGDDRSMPLLQRPGPQTVLQERDPIRQLHLFAQDISGILERVAPVFEVMRMAAKTEPEIAEQLKKLLEARLRNLAKVAQNLAAHTSLRDGMSEGQAAEFIWTVTSPEVFSLLTVDRGWSRERYVHWLSDTLTRWLLP